MENSEPVRPMSLNSGESWLSAAMPVLVVALVLGGVYLWPRLLTGLGVCLALALAAFIVQLIIRHPLWTVGAFLVYIPIDFLVVALLRFFGVPYVEATSACLDGVLVLAIWSLWRKNGFRATAADWFLSLFVGISSLYSLFGGTFQDFKLEFMWILPYLAGRVTILDAVRARSWAIRAIWIGGVLSVAGAFEIFVLGPLPRTILYAALVRPLADEKGLGGSATATGYRWLREASTMASPLEFAGLCMICVIIWWVYSRRPIPGALVFAGLVLTVTRSAWIGTLLAVPVLAVRLRKKKLLLTSLCVAAVAIMTIGVAIGLDAGYLHPSQDPSTQGHIGTFESGLQYLSEHPFGTGLGSVGEGAIQNNLNGAYFESSFLQFGGEFGIESLVFFFAFLICAFRTAWSLRSLEGDAATGILIGFCIMMAVLPMHSHFQMSCWIWFPVGLAVAQASRLRSGERVEQIGNPDCPELSC